MVRLLFVAPHAHRRDKARIVRRGIGICAIRVARAIAERGMMIEARLVETGERLFAAATAKAKLANDNVDLYARWDRAAFYCVGDAEKPRHRENQSRLIDGSK
jgi:hypothetical protein